MLTLPYSPSPSASSAWSQGFVKAFVSQSSPSPDPGVDAGDLDAFNQGVSDGATAQTTGIDIGVSCISGQAAPSSDSILDVFHGMEALEGIEKTLRIGFAAGIADLFSVTFFFLILSNDPPMDPSLNFESLGQTAVDRLTSIGVQSMALFCGVGIDTDSAGCEFKLSPLFKTEDEARSAASASGRPTVSIVSWRTDQCGSFTVVA